MGIDAGRRIVLAVLLAMLRSAGAAAEPRIVWKVENPFRFFLDRPTPRCIARPGPASPEAERSHPCWPPSACWPSAIPTAWSATMFAKTCWDPGPTVRLPRAARLSQPQEPHHPGAPGSWRTPQTVDCTWLTAPQGRGARGKAVTLPCDTPVQLEIPYPDGAWIKVEIGGRQVAEVAARVTDLFIVGMGDSFASGEGNPDVPVRFSPDRTTDYETAPTKRRSRGYPARIGDWQAIGDREFIEENARWQDQACHRSLYSHQLRAALQLAVEDPHRAVTFVGRGLLGRGDDVRPVPATTRATSGCRTRPSCRRSRRWPRPSAAARARATTTCPRPTTSTRASPS